MAARRNRMFRSSSQGEFGGFTQLMLPVESPLVSRFQNKRFAAAPSPTAAPKPTAPPPKKKEQPRPRIFFIGSPDREVNKEKKIDEAFGAFAKACALCKKPLTQDHDLFMYGYLTAYCSADCRDDRIALDGFNEAVDKAARDLKIQVKHPAKRLPRF